MSNSDNFQAPSPFGHFEYGDIQIREAGFIGMTPCFTRRAIGEWLEYKYPQEAIDRIVKRNPHISNPEWAILIKLAVAQSTGKREHTSQTDLYARELQMEVYTPIGLQLIVFESRQPKAIEYKIAVARLVNDIMTGEFTQKLMLGFASGKIPMSGPSLAPWDTLIKR